MCAEKLLHGAGGMQKEPLNDPFPVIARGSFLIHHHSSSQLLLSAFQIAKFENENGLNVSIKLSIEVNELIKAISLPLCQLR